MEKSNNTTAAPFLVSTATITTTPATQFPSPTLPLSALPAQQQQQQQQQQQTPPAPTAQVLHLISALSNPEPAHVHVQALQARDQALSASLTSYSELCLQLAFCLVGCDQPRTMLSHVKSLESWQQQDPETFTRLVLQPQHEFDDSLWIPFGQMAGLVLKNALIRPPKTASTNGMDGVLGGGGGGGQFMALPEGQITDQIKETLLFALGCRNAALRSVASSVIAVTAVSHRRHIQPALHVRQWPQLVPTLIHHLQQQVPQQNHNNNVWLLEGSLSTVLKMMEDGPSQLPPGDVDALVPVLLQLLQNPQFISEQSRVHALQILCTCVTLPTLPSALVLHFASYLVTLSTLAAQPDPTWNVKKCICQSLVTILEVRTEYLQNQFTSIAQFMLDCTAVTTATTTTVASSQVIPLAAQACEFWLTFCSLDELAITPVMTETVQALFPRLIPILLHNMVYQPDQQAAILARNEMDLQEQQQQDASTSDQSRKKEVLRPVFHKSRPPKHFRTAGSSSQSSTTTALQRHDDGDEVVNDGDYDDDDDNEDNNIGDDEGYEQDDETGFDADEDDDDGHEWTLRKCAAASLDAMANFYGAEPLLPCLLPELERGLAPTADPWTQEASILALGAIAEGCREEMSPHLSQLHSYLMTHLDKRPSSSANYMHSTAAKTILNTSASSLPQVSCIAAWTLGRYAPWAVEQVQSGAQGMLLGHMTEVFLHRLTTDPNRRVQVAVCSALRQVVEAAGDLLTPYLPPIYQALVSRFSPTVVVGDRTLLLVLDLFGHLADCCGPATAEHNLPALYVPPLVQLWNKLAQHDPADRTLLPLMECLASIALTVGHHFQPYALECFENAMATIETVQLQLATSTPSSTTTGGIDSPSSHPLDHTATTETTANEEEADPIVCATDLLDGLVEGLGSNFTALIASSSRFGGPSNPHHFMGVVHTLCQHVVPGVRMSALALVGDVARLAPRLLDPVLLPQLLQQSLLTNMDPIQPTVCHNAVWATGEICVHCCPGLQPQPLEPLVPTLMQHLIALLMGNGVVVVATAGGGSGGMMMNNDNNNHRGCDIPGVAENAAACLGRLALVNPAFVCPDLSRVLLGWCDGLAKIIDPTERRDAYKGFLQTLAAAPHPAAILSSATGASSPEEAVMAIVWAVLAWHIVRPNKNDDDDDDMRWNQDNNDNNSNYSLGPFPPQEAELRESVYSLVHQLKQFVGPELWSRVQTSLPRNVQRLLREQYQLE